MNDWDSKQKLLEANSSKTMITIRQETPDDFDTVRKLTVDAFSACEFGHNGEAELIEKLRANHCDLISLIAERDNERLGHLLFSPAVLVSAFADLSCLILR
jgi:putative acetyltransferase